jgi:hypothetical protein
LRLLPLRTSAVVALRLLVTRLALRRWWLVLWLLWLLLRGSFIILSRALRPRSSGVSIFRSRVRAVLSLLISHVAIVGVLAIR